MKVTTLDRSENDVTSLSEQNDTDLFPKLSVTPQETDLVELLHSAHFNWFEFTCLAEERGISRSVPDEQFENLCSKISETECKLVKQSHAACLVIEELPKQLCCCN